MSGDIVLTETSYKQLQQELELLKSVKRPELSEAIRKARAYGDLSENFEYHQARRDQGMLNARISDMERTLELAKVVPDDVHAGVDSVGLGSIAMVRDLDTGDEWEYTLVDPVQADPINDRISASSPVGKALMGTRPGDVVQVLIPAGTAQYEVVAIRRE